jgi:ribosomal protein S18 acetylase RimI-like enzyme
MKINIRKAEEEDITFLWKILYYAAIWNPAENNLPIETALVIPVIKKILDGWGGKGDTAIVAETSNQEKMGAAWYRYWTTENHSFGFVDECIPELGIATIPEFRSKGAGNKLLKALIAEAKKQNVKALSLSVAKKNPAVNLYIKNGFEILKEKKNDYLMILKLK